MGFIQEAYININSSDIKNVLEEKLKYKNNWYHLLKCHAIGTIIDNNGNGYYYGITDESDIKPSQFNCNNNIQLFLAIAALKDNTDIHQWMICTMEHTDPDDNTYYNIGDWKLSDRKTMKKIKRNNVWRKATLDEIKEHFK